MYNFHPVSSWLRGFVTPSTIPVLIMHEPSARAFTPSPHQSPPRGTARMRSCNASRRGEATRAFMSEDKSKFSADWNMNIVCFVRYGLIDSDFVF